MTYHLALLLFIAGTVWLALGILWAIVGIVRRYRAEREWRRRNRWTR